MNKQLESFSSKLERKDYILIYQNRISKLEEIVKTNQINLYNKYKNSLYQNIYEEINHLQINLNQLKTSNIVLF